MTRTKTFTLQWPRGDSWHAIKGGSRKTYELPPAEYKFEGDDTSADDVLEKAKSAAKRTGHKARILVTTGARHWQGLGQA
jgi:hypothetical protein